MSRLLRTSWLTALVALVPLSFAQTTSEAGATRDSDVAARAFDAAVSWADLDVVFLQRRALSKDGRDALRHLADSKLLERMGREQGLLLDDQALEARVKALEAEMRAAGEVDGLATFLKKGRLSRDELKRFLGLAHVHEMLTRRALGLRPDAPVSGDQQRLWIDEELARHGYQEFTAPWKDGLVAKAGDFEIREDEFVEYLRRRLPVEALREDCYQLLLLRRIEARMPDASPETVARYVDAEIARRKREAEADPRYRGVPFEKLLAAQGVLVERLGDDPSVRIAALARLWIDRTHDEEALKRFYASERETFDARYGAAIDTSMLFLRAGEFKNAYVPRTFAEARAEIVQLAKDVRSAEDLQRVAKERSEDAASREASGHVGFLTPGEPKLPVALREVIAQALASSAAPGLSGPHNLPTGVALVWLGARRPSPPWSEMQEHVHRELRRRFVEEVLPKSSVITSFEGN